MSGEHPHPDLDEALAALQTRVEQLAGRCAALEAADADLVRQVDSMVVWHDYSGKPADSQTIPAGDYVRLDVDVADPPRTGALELHMLYANAALKWKTGGASGVIRVKYVREDGDETAYQDHTVSREATFGSPASFLITAVHWETGKAGIGGRWWIKCGGDLSSIVLTTRYAKICQIG